MSWFSWGLLLGLRRNVDSGSFGMPLRCAVVFEFVAVECHVCCLKVIEYEDCEAVASRGALACGSLGQGCGHQADTNLGATNQAESADPCSPALPPPIV